MNKKQTNIVRCQVAMTKFVQIDVPVDETTLFFDVEREAKRMAQDAYGIYDRVTVEDFERATD